MLNCPEYEYHHHITEWHAWSRSNNWILYETLYDNTLTKCKYPFDR
jgi:hypothetical protein